MAYRFFDFSELTPAQRVDLAVELWDSLPEDSIDPPLTEAQRAELESRLEQYHRDPKSGSSWAEVRERIQRNLYNKK